MTGQHKHHRNTFSDAALLEVEAIEQRISEALRGRPHVRGITIDGPTSRDLDDAFWLERDQQGGYRLDVSIADAGSFVTPLTPTLDQEAQARSFTRYYADRNVSMLPRQLSEAGLSLLPAQLRPTITFSLLLDRQLRVGEPTIAHTVVSNERRFSYDEVDYAIEHSRTAFAPMLQDAFRIAQRLLQTRRAGGALAFYDLLTGWVTTEEGVLVQLREGNRHQAHIIIQEFMILANQALARYFAQRGILALYRNHAAKAISPERSSLLAMLENAVLHPAQAHPERVSATINLTMERARYAPTVAGHFGLNLPAYLHMTSPIRRYPDLVNQRILHAILKEEPFPYTKAELAAIAAHVNAEEDAIKDTRSIFFRNEYDEQIRQMLAEEVQEQSTQPLDHLDIKQFHSVLRMAAEGHALAPAVEQEIVNRLEQQLLQANDLFTLIFRFQNEGDVWERVKRVCLEWLQHHPYHAVSLLLMGHQGLSWGEPEVVVEGPDYRGIFRATVAVQVAEQWYAAVHTATQKEAAKQRASAEVAAHIAGIALASTAHTTSASESTEIEAAQPLPLQPATPEAPSFPISGKNSMSVLNEMKQVGEIYEVSYTYASSGPSHHPTFTCICTLTSFDGSTQEASAEGKTKKEAAQKAAQDVLQLFRSDL